jgi:hypothetical protein
VLSCAAECSGVVVDGDGPGVLAARDPLARDGGGAAEVFGEDARVAGVDGAEEADNVSGGLDAELVEVEAVGKRDGATRRGG